MQVESTTETDVVIIGGGMAGLSAAFGLVKKKSDLKFCLVESSKRLGGRLKVEISFVYCFLTYLLNISFYF